MIHLLNPEQLAQWAQPVTHLPFAPLIFVLAFAVMSSLPISVNILAVAVSLLFQRPIEAYAISMAGALASSAFVFFLGKKFGNFEKISKKYPKAEQIRDLIYQKGFPAILLLRVTPIAPHCVANFIFGLLQVDFQFFILATFIGLTPGLLTFSILGARASRFVHHPLWIGAMFVLGLSVILFLKKYVEKELRKTLKKGKPGQSMERRV